MRLSRLWEELRSEPYTTGFATRRLHPDAEADIFAYLDLAAGTPSLRLLLPWAPGRKLPGLPHSYGLRCRGELHEAGRQMHVVVELLDLNLLDVFTPLVEDLAERSASGADAEEALENLAEGLGEWKQLLESMAASGMGTLARRGLVGELHVLGDLLLPRRGEASVAAWTGPFKANQDFQFSDVAIEVKVTTGKQPQAFRVANERELDERHTGQLLVAHVSIDERRGGEGRSLNDLVEQVMTQLDGQPQARRDLQDRLARVGYLQRDVSHYDEPRYGVRELRWFEVTPDFPRLVETDLPDGVGDVAYSVTLAACLPFERDQQTVESRLELAP